MSAIRVAVFTDRQDCVLVVAQDDEVVRLPEMTPPFTLSGVKDRLRSAGLDYKVFETIAGRWTTAYRQAKSNALAELGQKTRLGMAAQVALGLNSALPSVRERSTLLEEKTSVDQKIQHLKTSITEANRLRAQSNQFTHGYLDWLNELENLRNRSQAIQIRLGEIKKDERVAERARKRTRDEYLVGRLREIVPEDVFATICDDIEAELDEGSDSDPIHVIDRRIDKINRERHELVEQRNAMEMSRARVKFTCD